MWFPILVYAAMGAFAVGLFWLFRLVAPSAPQMPGLLFFVACVVVYVTAMRYSNRR
jgi:hypothetical protein